MKYGIANLLADADAVTFSGSTQAAFPLANLSIGRPSKGWKADEVTTDLYLEWDAGAGNVFTHELFAMFHHNLPAGGLYKWEGSDDASGGRWTGTDTTDVTLRTSGDAPDGGGAHDGWTFRAKDMYASIPSGGSGQRFERLLFRGPGGGNFAAKPAIGEIGLYDPVTLSKSFKWAALTRRQRNVIVQRTIARVPHLLKIGPHTKAFALTWSGLSRSQFGELETLWLGTGESAVPAAIIPYRGASGELNDRGAEIYFVLCDSDLDDVDNRAADIHAGLLFVEYPEAYVLT